MPIIIFHIIDQVGPDILIVLRDTSILSLFAEILVGLELLKLQLIVVLPPCDVILLIKLEGLSIVSWDLQSKNILR